MGAWGAAPFENDDASDWARELDGVDATTGERILAKALDLGEPSKYLELPEGANAVAAAAVVAWLHDPGVIPDTPYGEAAAVWVRTARPTPSASLLADALAVLHRVRSDQSELAELWAKSDDGAAWRESLEQIEPCFSTAEHRVGGPWL